MKVVFDTNVLVAAFVARGQCSDVLRHCARHHTLVTSSFILEEFRAAMTQKLHVSAQDVVRAVDLLRARMEVVTRRPLERPVCRDPDDDWVLGTALTGECQCLITGDADLLVLERHGGVDILRPASFWSYEVSQPDPAAEP